MTTHLTLEQITHTDKAAVEEARKVLLSAIAHNDAGFLKCFETNDIASMKKHITWGVSWEKQSFWKDVDRSSAANLSLETIELLWNWPAENPTIEDDRIYFKSHYSITSSGRENWKKLLVAKILKSLQYGQPNVDLFLWMSDKYHSKINEIETFTKILTNFSNGNMALPKYQPFHKILIGKYNHHVHLLFENTKIKENIEFLTSSPLYRNAFNSYMEKEQNSQAELMKKAVSSGNVERIKLWLDKGIPLPTKKEAYSVLFASLKNWDAIVFICDNIPDITVGQQVILRTVLNRNLDTVVPLILEKYQPEHIEQLPLAVKDRSPSESTKIVEAWMDYYHLDNALAPKAAGSRKNKI